MSPTVYQTEHGLLCEVMRSFLVGEVQSSRGVGRSGGAAAALYSLLIAHPVDQQGRCRSCRGPGWLRRRRRVCMVFQKAHYWLRLPSHRVIIHLASDLGVNVPQLSDVADPDATDVLPRIELETGDPPTQSLQTPAVSPTPRFPAGRPDLDHGGAGAHPDGPRSRRVPPVNPPPRPHSDGSLLLVGVGGMA